MNIALDYDKTYTNDPELWDSFIRLSVDRGHSVAIVTMRYPSECVGEMQVPVIYTSRKAKQDFYSADVWVDDSPVHIYKDYV